MLKEHKLKLHLGCGWRDFGKSWVHIDGGNYEHLDSKDITALPYEDNSVDIIYASHVLEYFDREEVKAVLKEWQRALKPGGLLYLSVPDFQIMAELYICQSIPLHKFVGPLYGKMEMANKTIYHKTVYDYASLGELLKFLGFKRIEPYNPVDLIGNHDDHSKAEINGELISLNLVCEK